MDLEENDGKSRIWMVPVEGGEAIPMTAKGSSASQPGWSPDGKYLSFLSARNDDKAQVWTLFRKGGDSVQLTEVTQGVKSYDWSPDGSKIAFGSLRSGNLDIWVIDVPNAGIISGRSTSWSRIKALIR